jgi:hypothetical protein
MAPSGLEHVHSTSGPAWRRKSSYTELGDGAVHLTRQREQTLCTTEKRARRQMKKCIEERGCALFLLPSPLGCKNAMTFASSIGEETSCPQYPAVGLVTGREK